jgi:predicted peroxiredoxin
MAATLVHLTHGPEQPGRAARAFKVARAASQQGHAVTLFLAGDATRFARDEAQLGSLDEPVCRALRQSCKAALDAGARVRISEAWALNQHGALPKAERADLARPNLLVRLAAEHDQVFSY